MSRIYKKTSICSDDLFATVSFGGGGGGGGSRSRRRSAAAAQNTVAKKDDHCTWAPDRVWGSDISGACEKHDTNYANGIWRSRRPWSTKN